MNRLQKAVLEFNEKGGQYVAEEAGLPPVGNFYKQLHLLEEELGELYEALDQENWIEAVDGAIDSLYVLLHFFNMMGVDLDPLFDEVQKSNMSKADPETGEFIMQDGKIQKGPAYRKPDLESRLDEAARNFQNRNQGGNRE